MVQAFTASPVLARFKLAPVTKSGARLCSMQSNNLVGDRFEDDDKETIVRVNKFFLPCPAQADGLVARLAPHLISVTLRTLKAAR